MDGKLELITTLQGMQYSQSKFLLLAVVNLIFKIPMLRLSQTSQVRLKSLTARRSQSMKSIIDKLR